jgi:sugar lactone lactonase YvrE
MNPNLREVVWGLRWAESPRWHHDSLFVSDTAGKRLLRTTLTGPPETVLTLEAQPNGTWPTNHGLAVASMFDHQVITVRDGSVTGSRDLSPLARGPLGDMYGDQEGGLFVGDFGSFGQTDHKPPVAGQLLYVPADDVAYIAAHNLAYPNGIVIVDDGSHLVVAESNGYRLTSFEVTAPGRLTRRRVYADLSQFDGRPLRPDGIWADGADGIWIAGTDRSAFVRMTKSGVSEMLDVAPLRAIACCIGGEQNDTLFLTVADVRGTHESVLAAIEAGDTEAGVLATPVPTTRRV